MNFFDLVILAALTAFFFLNPEKQTIDENVRNITPGDFVELSHGFVHYELSGAPEVLPVSEEDIFPMNVPLLGEWIVGVYLVPFHLPQSQLDDFYHPQDFPGWEEKYRDQLQYKGFKNAILSTIRNLVTFNPLDVYESLNKSGLPILLIWGKEDQSVSYEAIVELMERLPNVESIFIDETGHLPHYEKAEVVNPMIIQFLQNIP